ncbi:rCG31512, partial [Rattus norvegicus]
MLRLKGVQHHCP